VMLYLTNGNMLIAVGISLATSGLLMALMLTGQTLLKSGSTLGFGIVLMVIALGVHCLDVYFDSLTADYLRYGQIIVLDTLPDKDVHKWFRVLIGGISTVGEQLAISIILGMPVLKNLISNALPTSTNTHQTKSKYNPAPKKVSLVADDEIFSSIPKAQKDKKRVYHPVGMSPWSK